MKKFCIYFFAIVIALMAGSCDIIEGPYLEEHSNGGEPGEKTQVNVLLIEFTGHTCKSCPKAHRTIDQLNELYGERVIPVAFHTGYFARTLSGEKFTTDFRTPEGAELESYFEMEIFPIGVVGNLDKNSLLTYSSWPSEVSALLENETPVDLSTSIEYNIGTREARVALNLLNKTALEGDVRLAMYLVEDGIISWQKDEDQDPIDVEDYEHKHVFRTSLGSVWGETLTESECSPNVSVKINRSLVLNPDWVAENCSIVSFLYMASTREVIQCTTKPLIQ